MRLLRPGDEEIVVALGEERALSREVAAELLGDPAVRFLVAFEDGEPVGFALAYVLRRRRLPERSLFLYEIEVAERLRRRGIGGRLLDEVAGVARAEGAAEGFVITSRSNGPALALYLAAGGVVADDADVEVDFSYRSERMETRR